MIGVYIHIPFCRTRCPYCDFVSNPIGGTVPEDFVDALCAELSAFDGPAKAQSVFIGGGTPSLLDAAALERVLSSVHKRFRFSDAEVTLEANPDDVTEELADAWRALGINRVSLGVQSFDDGVLRHLGRRHDAAGARAACQCVAERFANWGMDLIFGAPHSAAAWEATLDTCTAFAPRHASVYGLTYESETPFGARGGEAIDDSEWVALYRSAEETLVAFRHYEISNYAQPGFECRHNLIYWSNGEYAGFGPGAYSFLDGVRARNAAGLDAYLRQPGLKAEALRLSDREIRIETVMQRLRLADGLNKANYERRFNNAVRHDFASALDALLERGLIAEDHVSIRPTPAGFLWNNEIGLALIGA